MSLFKKFIMLFTPVALTVSGTAVYYTIKNKETETNDLKKISSLKNMIFDVVTTSHNNLPGNRNVPTWKTPKDWGIKKNDLFFEDNVDLDQEPNISFVSYDFTDDHVNALLTYSVGSKKYEKEIIINGFAKAKTSLKDVSNKIITSNEFKYVVLPDDFVLPDVLEEINIDAFAFAHIPASFNIENLSTLKIIRDGAFSSAKLPWNFKIPDSVKTIGDGIFRNTELPPNWKNPKIWETQLGFRSYWGALLPPNFTKIIDSVKVFKSDSLKNVILPPDFQLPQNTEKLSGNPFYGATLPGNFNLKSFKSGSFIATQILVGGYAGAIFSDGFTLTPNNTLRRINKSAFRGAYLPIGFKIPVSATNVDDNAFFGARIPFNAKWSHNSITTSPEGGSEVIAK